MREYLLGKNVLGAMEMDLITELRNGEMFGWSGYVYRLCVNTPSNSFTTVKSPGHHQMEKPNEKAENQKSTKNNNDLNGNATQKQITDV